MTVRGNRFLPEFRGVTEYRITLTIRNTTLGPSLPGGRAVAISFFRRPSGAAVSLNSHHCKRDHSLRLSGPAFSDRSYALGRLELHRNAFDFDFEGRGEPLPNGRPVFLQLRPLQDDGGIHV